MIPLILVCYADHGPVIGSTAPRNFALICAFLDARVVALLTFSEHKINSIAT